MAGSRRMSSFGHSIIHSSFVIRISSLLILVACAAHESAPPPPSPDHTPVVSQVTIPQSEGISVYAYQVLMPRGAASRNPKFWKLLNEDVVDQATNDMLQFNGLRLGRAPMASYHDGLDATLDTEKTAERWTVCFLPVQGICYVEMTSEMEEETIFVFNEHGASGRTFEHCQNRFGVYCTWEPHQPNTLRLSICPIVETWRKRLDYSMSDDPVEQKYNSVESMYDLHLRADLGPDDLVVLGTSPEADDPYRVGNRFMTRQGRTDRFEEVVVLSRRPLTFVRARQLGGATSRPASAPPPSMR
jgi:hypothetical protein